MKPNSLSRPALPPPLAKLLNELEADHAFGPEVAAPLREALISLDRAGDDCWDSGQCFQALALVAAQPRPARDRFIDIAEIVQARGRVTIVIRKP
jgi:hypothetical protein